MVWFLITYTIYQNDMIEYDGKSWIRTCNNCGKELKYKYKRSANFQEIKNSVCRSCSNYKEFADIYKNFNGLWCRRCSKCNIELSYRTRQSCIVWFHKNSLCKSCNQKGDNAFWYGKKMSKFTKRKMSIKKIGKRLSKITRQKLSESKK